MDPFAFATTPHCRSVGLHAIAALSARSVPSWDVGIRHVRVTARSPRSARANHAARWLAPSRSSLNTTPHASPAGAANAKELPCPSRGVAARRVVSASDASSAATFTSSGDVPSGPLQERDHPSSYAATRGSWMGDSE